MTLSDGSGLIRGARFTAAVTLAQPSEVIEDVRVGGGLSPLPALIIAVCTGLITAALFTSADAMVSVFK